MKHLKLCIILSLILFLCSCNSDSERIIGLYGFLIDKDNGESIECIAYYEEDDGCTYITNFFSKFGELEPDDYIYSLNYENKSESKYEYNSFFVNNEYSQSFCTGGNLSTVESCFVFEYVRMATANDYNRIQEYKRFNKGFCVIKQSDEYDLGIKVLHNSNSSCIKNYKEVIYVSNFTEAAYTQAALCPECFPEYFE